MVSPLLTWGSIAFISGALLYCIRRYVAGKDCPSKANMAGKVVVITGGNNGIGYECGLELARRGAKVILACRNPQLGQEAAATIRSQTSNPNVSSMVLDLSSLQSVRTFAQKLLQQEARLDVLVNNAGIAMGPLSYTQDGYESMFGVNHLGHFLLTMLLLPLLKRSAPSRVVVVASDAHKFAPKIDFENLLYRKNNYAQFGTYGESKLANLLFARSLSNRIQASGDNVSVISVHPGAVRTNIGYNRTNWFMKAVFYLFTPVRYLLMKSAKEGAQSLIHASVGHEWENSHNIYLVDCEPTPVAPQARDEEAAEELWRLSEKLTGVLPA